MPIAIAQELSADPQRLVVQPARTRLHFTVKVFGEALTATITYRLPDNRPVRFVSANTEPPLVEINPPSKSFTVKNFPLPSDVDVDVDVEFIQEGAPNALTFDVTATVLANDGSAVTTSCDILF